METSVAIGENTVDVYLSLSLKGEPLTVPGDLFKESPEIEDFYTHIVKAGEDNIRRSLEDGINGRLVSVNSRDF